MKRDYIINMALEAGGRMYSSDEVDFFIPDLNRFVELIVRECIVDFYRNYLDTTSDEDITEQVERYVKQNFGVE